MGGCCSSETDKHTELATANLQPYPPYSVTPPNRLSTVGQATPSKSVRNGAPKVVISTPPTSPASPAGKSAAGTPAGSGKPQSILRKASSHESIVKDFLRKAASGLPVVILLGSGYGIECILRVDQSRQMLVLVKDDLKKETPFSDISRVLSSPAELGRIMTNAKLDDHCSALYTPHDSSCIVFAFDSLEENVAFVQTAQRLINTPK